MRILFYSVGILWFANCSLAEETKGTFRYEKILASCDEKVEWANTKLSTEWSAWGACMKATGSSEGLEVVYSESVDCDHQPIVATLTAAWDCNHYPERLGVADFTGACQIETAEGTIRKSFAVDSDRQLGVIPFYRDKNKNFAYSIIVTNYYKVRASSVVKLELVYHPPFVNPGEPPDVPVDPEPIYRSKTIAAANGNEMDLFVEAKDLKIACKGNVVLAE